MANKPNLAFTLIELLVVISIIAILAALLMPSIGRVKEDSITTKCASNIRQIMAAAFLFASDHNGNLPRMSHPIIDSPPIPEELRVTNNDSSYFWEDLLVPYAPNPKIFSCPKLTGAATEAQGAGKSDKYALGIGINWNVMAKNYTEPNIWVQQQQVLKPSRMVWFTDAANVSKTGSSWDGMVEPPNGGSAYFRGNGVAAGSSVMPRHNGKINVGFADGHVVLAAPDDIEWGLEGSGQAGKSYIGFSDF